MLHDQSDPTVALFISEGAASKAARMVAQQHSKVVSVADPKPRKQRGEMLGYGVLIHFKDNRRSSWLTNSDFERLH